LEYKYYEHLNIIMLNSQTLDKGFLSKTFCFFYRILNEKQAIPHHPNRDQYQNHVKKISSFNNVDDFLAIFQHLKKPDSSSPGVTFYLVKFY
jgi:hypothetical protein